MKDLPAHLWTPSEHGYGLMAGIDFPAGTSLATLRAALRRHAHTRGLTLHTMRMLDASGAVIGLAVRVVSPETVHRKTLVRLARKQIG